MPDRPLSFESRDALISEPEYVALAAEPLALALLAKIRFRMLAAERARQIGGLRPASPVSVAETADDWGVDVHRLRSAALCLIEAEQVVSLADSFGGITAWIAP